MNIKLLKYFGDFKTNGWYLILKVKLSTVFKISSKIQAILIEI